ncbi:MAG: hypothetical protein PUE71_02155 [Clostridia bacterium]|nr:hypothetical protein [Clostridia bacterium]
MYFTTSSNTGTYGAYRRSKMVIDALNIVLAIVIVVLFVALIFLNDHRSLLFPLIFLAGGIDNALAAAKNFMNYNRIGGIVLTAITIFLFVLAVICFRIR